MEFIVSIGVGFSEVLTGGVLVLHKIAYELANRGFKVNIFTDPQYPHENIIVRKNCSEDRLDFDYNPEKTVIIPSYNWKNSSNIKNVARWALYHIDQNENVDEQDEIFNFGTFDTKTKKITGKLTTFDYQQEIFVNKGKLRKKGYCHILLKNNPPQPQEIISYFNSFSLDDYKTKGCFEYLAEKFNEFEYFLTFDDKTFLTTAAAMCGCKSIILNNNNISPQEFKKENPIQALGVAYGMEDLNWSEKTLQFVPEHIKFLQEQDNKTIDNFINFWQNKIYNL